ncbi:sulfatase [Jejuia pallidilutea]|uniref:Choline-sulfatase n=1 Tax=Jejuia pallidilutea TaxID=504487 RepID=A0A090W6X4_9FLAO|nr:sulfatase [Jejuia pallidilutea]GAL65631.1 choline-sulfatase [Jejuia pallidilutea]GAL72686.1 choline-sulfatase [Jejuia pallidilutea]GAL88684.1 choline-sulfatase [Jejuia pallidilutea]
MKILSKIAVLSFLITPLSAYCQIKKDTNFKPNIIFIMADDLGWTDISSPNTSLGNGSKYYESPNIDKLAEQGMSFTYAYTQQNCQPTRASLLTGQYPTGSQNGIYNVGSLKRASKGVVTPITPHVQNNYLKESCISIFETLKTEGYHTAWFGKLHAIKKEEHATSYLGVDYNLSLRKETNATVNGVKVKNEFFAQEDDDKGWIFSNEKLKPYAKPYDSTYIYNVLEPVKNGNNPQLLEGTPKHLTDALGDAVVDYIKDRSQKDSPFFAYIPFHAVHVSILPRPDLETKYKTKASQDPRHSKANYAAFVELLDQTVGRILNALEDPNGDGNTKDRISENTLVVFYSDNGGFMGPTDNTPLRLRKGTYYEGGLRVPLIFRYPGVIKPNTVNTTQEVHAIDFYPTLAEIAGAKLPNPQTHEVDGKSVSPILRGEVEALSSKNELFWHFPGYMDIRNMPQSVIHYRHSNNQHYKLFYRYEDESYELYNLSNDIGETNNLLEVSPSLEILDLALIMNNKLRTWLITKNAPTGTWKKNGEKVPYPLKNGVKKYVK